MKKLMLLSAIVAALCVNLAPSTALAVNADVIVTLPLDSIAVTNTITIPAGMAIDHLVIKNQAAFSNTVSLVAYDADVVGATLYSGTILAATGSAYTYPVRAMDDGMRTQALYTVKQVRCIVTSASGSTNATTGLVRILLQSPFDD